MTNTIALYAISDKNVLLFMSMNDTSNITHLDMRS